MRMRLPHFKYYEWSKDISKEKVSAIIHLLAFLCIFNLLSGNFGVFEPSFQRLIAFLILIGVVVFDLTDKPKHVSISSKDHRNSIYTGAVLLIISFAVLLFTTQRVLWFASVLLTTISIAILLNGLNIKRDETPLIISLSIFYTLFMVFVENIPILWYGIQRFSYIISSAFGFLVDTPMIMGPSVGGLWIVISFLILYTTLVFYTKTVKPFLLTVFFTFILWFIYLFMVRTYPFSDLTEIINSQHILFFLETIPAAIYMAKTLQFGPTMHRVSIKKLNGKTVAALTLIFVSLILLTSFPLGTGEKTGNILFHRENMVANWNKPEYGRYELHTHGMFGFLPDYLNETGYNATVTDQPLSSNLLSNVDTLVVINLDRSYSQKEYNTIWDFVKNGGSLLVLGDHTDLGGIQQPLNNLLKPVGIRFRFDSAMSVKERWESCMQFLNHPITYDVDGDLTGWSVGASLDISNPSSFPVVIGRYAYSDHGNRWNSVESYLGDYLYEYNEEAGDLILVAGAFYGDGKVLVFGDTTTFQNPTLPTSHKFIGNVFKWLNTGCTSTFYLLQKGLALIFLTAGAFLLYHAEESRKKREIMRYIIPIVISASFILSASSTFFTYRGEEIEEQSRIAYLDYSHGEKIDLITYSDTSVTGLSVNLERNNYLPLIFQDFSKERLSNCKILVIIAPTERFTGQEVGFIREFMVKGGLVIVGAGYYERNNVLPLLKPLDLDIENIPLGPTPYKTGSDEEPEFVDAWAVEVGDPVNTDVFYQLEVKNATYGLGKNNTYNIVVFKRYGAGGFLLVGDGQFLYSKNIEMASAHNMGNILFLKNIFDELRWRGVLS
ncbi:MAG: hypothetical protein J7L32_02555 [Thermoplasmata archaeon]|nr:hypothetical protein [Thermoplasmata archaeon]